jgi:arginine repressor
VLGSVAGDDTIFVAPRGNVSPRRLADALETLFGRGAKRQ